MNTSWRCWSMWLVVTALVIAFATGTARELRAQDTAQVRELDDRVAFRFVEADLRAVIQALGRYLTKPVIMGDLPGKPVTLETPVPVLRARLPELLRGLAEAHGLELLEDSAFFRVGQRSAAPGGGLPAEQVQEAVRLSVVRLKQARAADVAATVNLLFGGAGAFAEAGFTTGTLSDELRRTADRTTQQPRAGETQPHERASAELTGPVTIVPDELTNALLVRATEADLALIQDAVQQLDVRPLQVLIQVLIVEVRRDRGFSLGVEASAESLAVKGGGTLSAFLFGGGLGDFVLRVMDLGRYEVDAVLGAAVRRGDARIVSRPVVVASNNREARILVGSQRPFVQVSRSLPTDAPTRDQVVQYRDVGTKLSVLPTINTDGYVSLLIRQEVNSATGETQFDAPVIATREAETTVLVKDGQTVVLGGLRERQHDVFKSGVPLLSSLPLVGGLFGFQERRTTETELFLFITPTVLADDTAAEEAAERALEQVGKNGVQLPPGREPR